jgi:hypothetical protein
MSATTQEAPAAHQGLEENTEPVEPRVVPDGQSVNLMDEFGPDALGRVREYRRAARTAARRETAPVKKRLLALLDLMNAARAEQDLTVREWAERVVQEEAGEFLGFAEQPASRGDPQARKHRQLERKASSGARTATRGCWMRLTSPARRRSDRWS